MMLKMVEKLGGDDSGPHGTRHYGSIAKGLKAGREVKEEIYDNTEALIEEFRENCRFECKVHEGGSFTWDLPEKGLIRFGKMRGLRRIYAALAQVIRVLDSPGNRRLGLAHIIQIQKCLRQVALDKGKYQWC